MPSLTLPDRLIWFAHCPHLGRACYGLAVRRGGGASPLGLGPLVGSWMARLPAPPPARHADAQGAGLSPVFPLAEAHAGGSAPEPPRLRQPPPPAGRFRTGRGGVPPRRRAWRGPRLARRYHRRRPLRSAARMKSGAVLRVAPADRARI